MLLARSVSQLSQIGLWLHHRGLWQCLSQRLSLLLQPNQ
jgi:hypothetical protein